MSPINSSSSSTLVAVCLATFILLVNVASPIVALPAIGVDLAADFPQLQWILAGYALTLASLVLLAGALADHYGRRRVFLGGLGIYFVGSVGCLAATEATVLGLARGLQGGGAGVLFATSLALLAASYQGAARARALGLWGATVGVAFAVGPVIGGAATQWGSWRWMFAVNLPLIATVAVLTVRRVPESRNPASGPIDWSGATSLTLALGALVFAVIRGNPEGWRSAPILTALAVSAGAAAVFLLRQHRAAHPLVPLSLFRRPTFMGAALGALLTHASIFALTIYIVSWLLNVHGSAPLAAGLQLLPYAGIAAAVSVLAGRLALTPRTALAAGLTLSAAGCALFLLAGRESSWTALLPGLLVAGVGVGLVNPALAAAALDAVEPRHSGAAAGINNTFRQVGTALGVAALGAIVQRRVETDVADALPGAEGERVAALIATGNLPAALDATPIALHPLLVQTAGAAFTAGFHTVALIAAALAATGALLCLALVGLEGPRAGGAALRPHEPSGQTGAAAA